MVTSCPVKTQSQRAPNQLAVVVGERRLSFRQLDAEVTAWVGRLQARGVRPGSRVAILAWNGLSCVALLFAVRRLGAALAPLNPRLAGPELKALVHRLRPECLLVEEVLSDLLPDAERL